MQEESGSVAPTNSPQMVSSADKQRLSTTHLRKARAEVARKLGRELQEVLRHASLALLRLSEPEAISGLQIYCSSTFGAVHQLAKAADEESNTIGPENATQHLQTGSKMHAADGVGMTNFGWMQGVAFQVCNWQCGCNSVSVPVLKVMLCMFNNT